MTIILIFGVLGVKFTNISIIHVPDFEPPFYVRVIESFLERQKQVLNDKTCNANPKVREYVF